MSKVRAAALPMSPAQRSRTRYSRSSSCEQRLGAPHHLGVLGPGLLGGGVGEELHLVELVHAQQAPRVASRRSRLAPETGRARRQPEGKVGLVEDLVPEHRRERDLGRGDGPQVVAFEVVGVVGELGEVPGRHHRLGAHQRGGADLLVALTVAVQREGAEPPDEPGSEPPVEREHRPRQLRPPFEVEDAERGPDVPVRHTLMVAVGPRRLGPPPHHEIVLGPFPVGRLFVGKVGQPQELLAHLGQGRGRLGVERGLPLAQRPALLRCLRGEGGVAAAAGLADLTRQALHLAAQLVALAQRQAGPFVGLEQAVHLGPIDPPAGQGRLHRVGVLPGQADVDHGAQR